MHFSLFNAFIPEFSRDILYSHNVEMNGGNVIIVTRYKQDKINV